MYDRIEYLTKKYGISTEACLEAEKQEHCHICELPFKGNGGFSGRVYDHDKVTGTFRGVLCGYCNAKIIGPLESASRMSGLGVDELLMNIDKYLREDKSLTNCGYFARV